jgi:hypothetical protein
MSWQPIETAPKDCEIIVGDRSAKTIARAHYNPAHSIAWRLGPVGVEWGPALDTPPCWWLPAKIGTNPFKVPLPEPPAEQSSGRVR